MLSGSSTCNEKLGTISTSRGTVFSPKDDLAVQVIQAFKEVDCRKDIKIAGHLVTIDRNKNIADVESMLRKLFSGKNGEVNDNSFRKSHPSTTKTHHFEIFNQSFSTTLQNIVSPQSCLTYQAKVHLIIAIGMISSNSPINQYLNKNILSQITTFLGKKMTVTLPRRNSHFSSVFRDTPVNAPLKPMKPCYPREPKSLADRLIEEWEDKKKNNPKLQEILKSQIKKYPQLMKKSLEWINSNREFKRKYEAEGNKDILWAVAYSIMVINIASQNRRKGIRCDA